MKLSTRGSAQLCLMILGTACGPDALAGRFRNFTLHVEPTGHPEDQAAAWRTSDPDGAALMDALADRPIALWMGDWISDPEGYVDDAITRAGTELQVFVLYDIPHRDCGSFSAGGAPDAATYDTFIDGVAAGMDGRRSLVVLEPDALGVQDCLSSDQVDERHDLLSSAVDTLTAAGGHVYLDAGDSDWVPSDDMAAQLQASGVDRAEGFALNVSHTETTDDSIAYAEEIRAIIGKTAHYLVDTGRNGSGPTSDHQWCNPLGRSVGQDPTLRPGVTGCDGFLWIKAPGESDGNCNGGPDAGAWWASYGRDLAEAGGL